VSEAKRSGADKCDMPVRDFGPDPGACGPEGQRGVVRAPNILSPVTTLAWVERLLVSPIFLIWANVPITGSHGLEGLGDARRMPSDRWESSN
jgi:hypothetical protein